MASRIACGALLGGILSLLVPILVAGWAVVAISVTSVPLWAFANTAFWWSIFSGSLFTSGAVVGAWFAWFTDLDDES